MSNGVAYWRYPQPEDGQGAGSNEHRAWKIVRRLRVENTALQAERDRWQAACYGACALALGLASVLLLVMM